MIYHFDTADARAYGTDEAILLYNIVGWLRLNKAEGRNQFDGRTWTYNSARALAEVMDHMWSEDQIRRLVNKLTTKGVLRKGNFNREIGRRADDRTLWLALEDETRIKTSKPGQGGKKDDPPAPKDKKKPSAADEGNPADPPAI